MRPNKMWQIVIRIKKNDKTGKKRTFQAILDFLKKNKVSGATVWIGSNGYGKRGDANKLIEGILMNFPLMLEIIDEKSKLESLLPELKGIVGDNGLVTINEIGVL